MFTPKMQATTARSYAGILLSFNPKPKPLSQINPIVFLSPRRLSPSKKNPLPVLRCSLSAGEDSKGRKLYVVNLPWDFSAEQTVELFGQCGIVKDVQIIRQKNGKSRGFGYVTLASAEEARSAVEKFDSYELMGRKIRVEFANSFREQAPPPPPGDAAAESRHMIFVTNLAWKARSVHLNVFFSAKFKPLSAKVVFENPEGRSAGYGFVGFATMEEAEAAFAELDGKELLGRPVRLKISVQKDRELEGEAEKAVSTEEQYAKS